MNRLIKEIESNLENKNYLSALALTLTLPDICGKISYPEDKVGERYRKWYDKHIYPYELAPTEDNQLNEWIPNGLVIYKLRCNLLHDGSLDIDKEVKKEKGLEDSYNYKFRLTDKLSSIGILSEGKDEDSSVLVRIGVEDFCKKICAVAEGFYYNENSMEDIYNDIVIFDFG